LQPGDSLGFARWKDDSPDTGRISAAAHCEIDAFEALPATEQHFVGVLAESFGGDRRVGACLPRFCEIRFEGRLRPSALINSLVVHPSFAGRARARRWWDGSSTTRATISVRRPSPGR
ncbi:MAG: hypothetical protein PVH41_08860, partial [Anaerolineae bacterium]